MSGILIAFEGIDGSGKSTVIKYLEDKLKKEGHQVVKVATREMEKESIFQAVVEAYSLDRESPDYVALIDDYSLSRHSPAYMFFFQVLHAHKADCARRALEEGKIVIADRWDLSFFVYHENFGFLSKESDILREGISRLAFGNLRPHLGIYLDVSADKALDRRIWRGEIISNLEMERRFYTKATADYRLLAQRRGWTIVNANDEFEQVWETVWKLVQEVVK